MIGTITLNPSIDQHITVRNLVKDDANRALSITRYPGGKGVNVSKVIRELGGETKAYTIIAGTAGLLLTELVRKLDFPMAPMKINGDTRINTILTDVQDKTQTRISAPGPRVSEKDVRSFLKRLVAARPRPALWAFGGSLSAGMKAATYRDFIHVLQRQGVRCILDTDNEALKLGLEAEPFMIKPNEFEMQRLVGRRLSTVREYLSAARHLADRGVGVVVVSLGSRGALFVTLNDAFHVLTPKVSVKSKVGAGDSLIGGFALGLVKGHSLRDAARLGIAASTSAVMREAPRLCLRSDIAGLMPRIHIREL